MSCATRSRPMGGWVGDAKRRVRGEGGEMEFRTLQKYENHDLRKIIVTFVYQHCSFVSCSYLCSRMSNFHRMLSVMIADMTRETDDG